MAYVYVQSEMPTIGSATTVSARASMSEVIQKGIRGYISKGKPQHYDEPRFVPVACADHPDVELIRTETYHDICNHSWSCKCAVMSVIHTCPMCGNRHERVN